MLMEERSKKADRTVAVTTTKLALKYKDTNAVLKSMESKCIKNEVQLEELEQLNGLRWFRAIFLKSKKSFRLLAKY